MERQQTRNLQSGERVRVLYPQYAAQLAGVILSPEEEGKGGLTGYWLIQVEGQDMILALAPHEFELEP